MSLRGEVTPGKTPLLTSRYDIELTEVDGGLNGQNDIGEEAVTIDLTRDMALVVSHTFRQAPE
jgi:hypothetical protein